MSIECIFQFEALDSTRSLNQRSEFLFNKGIYHGGNVEAVAGQLQVVVHPFCLVSTDGMHVVSDADEYLPVSSGDYYVCCRAKYVMDDTPDVSLTTIACSTYESWSDEDKGLYVRFAKVSSAGFNVAVDTEYKESISPVGRNPYRGYYMSAEDLYAGATGAQDGDFAMVKSDDTSGATMYVYDSKQWHNHGSSAATEQSLMEHRANIDYEQSHSIPTENDVSDGQKRFNGAYHLNWNEAQALGSKLSKMSGNVQVEPVFESSVSFTGKGRVTAVRLLHRGTTITGLKKGDISVPMTATSNPSAEGQYRLDSNDCVIYIYGANGIAYTLTYTYSNYKKSVVLDNEFGTGMHPSDFQALEGNLYAGDGSDKPSGSNRFMTENTPTIARVAVAAASASNNRVKVTLPDGGKFYLGDTAYPSKKLFKLVDSEGNVARSSAGLPIVVTGVFKESSGSSAPDASGCFSESSEIYLGTDGIDAELAGTGFVAGMYVLCYARSTISGARVAGTLDQYDFKFGLVDTITARTSFLSVNDGVSGNSNVKVSPTYVKLYGKGAGATLTAEYASDKTAVIYSKASGSSVESGLKMTLDGTGTLYGNKVAVSGTTYATMKAPEVYLTGSYVKLNTDYNDGDVAIGHFYPADANKTSNTTIWGDIVNVYAGAAGLGLYGKYVYVGTRDDSVEILVGRPGTASTTINGGTTYIKSSTATYVNNDKGATYIGNTKAPTDIKGLDLMFSSNGSFTFNGAIGAFTTNTKTLSLSASSTASITAVSTNDIRGNELLLNYSGNGVTRIGSGKNLVTLWGSNIDLHSDTVYLANIMEGSSGTSTKRRNIELASSSGLHTPTGTNYNEVYIWAGHGGSGSTRLAWLRLKNDADNTASIELKTTCSKGSISLFARADDSRTPIALEGQSLRTDGGTPVHIRGVTRTATSSGSVLGVFIECVDDTPIQFNQYNRRGYARVSRDKIYLAVEGLKYESEGSSKPYLMLDGGIKGLTSESNPLSVQLGSSRGNISIATNNHVLHIRDKEFCTNGGSNNIVASAAGNNGTGTNSNFMVEWVMHQNRPISGVTNWQTYEGYVGMNSSRMLFATNHTRGSQSVLQLRSNWGFYNYTDSDAGAPGIDLFTGTPSNVSTGAGDAAYKAGLYLRSSGTAEIQATDTITLKSTLTNNGARLSISGNMVSMVSNYGGSNASLLLSSAQAYLSFGNTTVNLLNGNYLYLYSPNVYLGGRTPTTDIVHVGATLQADSLYYGHLIYGASASFTPYGGSSSTDPVFKGKSNCKINYVRIALNGAAVIGWAQNHDASDKVAANHPFVVLDSGKRLYISNNQAIEVQYTSAGSTKRRGFKPVYWMTDEY